MEDPRILSRSAFVVLPKHQFDCACARGSVLAGQWARSMPFFTSFITPACSFNYVASKARRAPVVFSTCHPGADQKRHSLRPARYHCSVVLASDQPMCWSTPASIMDIFYVKVTLFLAALLSLCKCAVINILVYLLVCEGAFLLGD